ncbi:uncharacterized protein DSM5745_09424 [Aspergillus mulundensis]|uniref:Uncharacterized protein n=1 Tax=Aspergillus mulundensis TaxID=1810919 RepID=A0A3D8QV86_9EURO|nr:hypothetical protein DSM5745_09424 [Aspergillus mulundensis]RDW65685.1 hypothetical protein DSM5745_09424 [Aspergillus mulundensis]
MQPFRTPQCPVCRKPATQSCLANGHFHRQNPSMMGPPMGAPRYPPSQARGYHPAQSSPFQGAARPNQSPPLSQAGTYIPGYNRRIPNGGTVEIAGHWRGNGQSLGPQRSQAQAQPQAQARAQAQSRAELEAANARIKQLQRRVQLNNIQATGYINHMRQQMSSNNEASQREIQSLTHRLWENNSRAEAEIQELRRRNEELERKVRFG